MNRKLLPAATVVWLMFAALAEPAHAGVRLGIRAIEVDGWIGVESCTTPNGLAHKMGIAQHSLIKKVRVKYIDNRGNDHTDTRWTTNMSAFASVLAHNGIYRITVTWQKNGRERSKTMVRPVRSYGGSEPPGDPDPDPWMPADDEEAANP
jgi:hypothetical protein